MSKGRKQRYKKESETRKWVLVSIDTFCFEEPSMISDPMPYDEALQVLNKAREEAGPSSFMQYSIKWVH